MPDGITAKRQYNITNNKKKKNVMLMLLLFIVYPKALMHEENFKSNYNIVWQGLHAALTLTFFPPSHTYCRFFW